MGDPKERPILFSAPMVRAILGGQKTQTRRVVKAAASWHHVTVERRDGINVPMVDREPDMVGGNWDELACPYGQPGDRLWVRETYALHHAWDGHPPTAGGSASKRVWHRADAPNAIDGRGRWRPSIHMPRWASRITLEVTSVRVERLQEISEADAGAEGLRGPLIDPALDRVVSQIGRTQRDAFSDLWKHINGPDSWDANPWVWVVGFRKIEVPRG